MRSEVNDVLRRGDGFVRSFGYALPPFAHMSPEELRGRRGELSTLVNCGLG